MGHHTQRQSACSSVEMPPSHPIVTATEHHNINYSLTATDQPSQWVTPLTNARTAYDSSPSENLIDRQHTDSFVKLWTRRPENYIVGLNSRLHCSGYQDLEVSLTRTLRDPNDGQPYSLPVYLGKFPLVEVIRLPEEPSGVSSTRR
ncbi:hypothetical protein FRC02_003838 [Tulasnella sp. 418]|nr:hypothetical protein FRC02_003838 [Tulasnella sp. 418]